MIFLDYYIDTTNFELMYMDTDSLYFALSADSLKDVIKPEKQHEHFAESQVQSIKTPETHQPALMKTTERFNWEKK